MWVLFDSFFILVNKPVLIKISVILVIALVIFTIIFGTMGNSSNTYNNDTQLISDDVSETKKFKHEVAGATKDMEEIINKDQVTSVPTEFKDLEKDIPHVEQLIAEVENQTGKKFTSIFDEEITLDPVKDKEFYELDQKFEELDTNIVDVVDQL